jgi:hypothetical protein
MTITKEQRAACLRELAAIAKGRRALAATGRYPVVCAALKELGWLDDVNHFFVIQPAPGSYGYKYDPDEVATALAMCVTLSEYSQNSKTE